MRRGKTRLIVLILGFVVSSGCVVGRVYRDRPLDEQKIATIQRGVTAEHQTEHMPPL